MAARQWQAPAGRALKPLLFVLCLLPMLYLAWGAATDGLGANPAERLIRDSGDWTLRLLCATLAVTPLRRLLAWPALARLRRMLGLFTFSYACLHLSCYAVLDMGLDVPAIVGDVLQRPFILVGMVAYALLLLLWLTSFATVIRRLGGRTWQTLHRSIYLVALLAMVHFFLMRAGKRDFAEVFAYGVLLAALLGARLPWWRRARWSAARRPGSLSQK
ncbi:sulfite oxidase heme-binding subunit YedZ [Comamonas flocculans]|uniref:Protein-methionine-sulfoxide reductase heme-binding subunit MsrQ n=1 Tax=Comamonas flocculans TaxID=2597701 RepID=A0A5B8RX62_9BURK|nr:protein-methionine-sulfoxide reductase heme-binding subunit MsrQ [Comamonas flocculans]QEA13673.1 sulfoxide reductase heme-binding subunit YedZ [Comamonas flocculans]